MISALPRCIIDTSTLFGTRSRKAVVAAANGKFIQAYWSPAIVDELYRVLTIKWIERYGSGRQSMEALSDSSKRMMKILTAALDVVDPKPPYTGWPNARDSDDNHLYCAAHVCKAHFVVSENSKDFPPNHTYDGISYITYATLLAIIDKNEADLI